MAGYRDDVPAPLVMKMNENNIVILILAIALLASCTTSQPNVNALQNVATRTSHEFNAAVRNGGKSRSGSIPEKYWLPLLNSLKPLRIYTHRVNMVVVQEESEEIEKGKYIYSTISSYLPTTGDDGFTFTTRNDGTWDYERRKD